MCSTPIVQAVTKPFVQVANTVTQAAKDVGSAFERNVSNPVKTAADNTGAWFESTISQNVKKAATDTGSWFESAVSDPVKDFYNNRNNWFTPPNRMPGSPEDTGSAGGPGPQATDVDLTDVLGRKKRARLSALKFGIMSTLGKGGATGAPSLFSPTATAPKLFLGQ